MSQIVILDSAGYTELALTHPAPLSICLPKPLGVQFDAKMDSHQSAPPH